MHAYKSGNAYGEPPCYLGGFFPIVRSGPSRRILTIVLPLISFIVHSQYR